MDENEDFLNFQGDEPASDFNLNSNESSQVKSSLVSLFDAPNNFVLEKDEE